MTLENEIILYCAAGVPEVQTEVTYWKRFDPAVSGLCWRLRDGVARPEPMRSDRVWDAGTIEDWTSSRTLGQSADNRIASLLAKGPADEDDSRPDHTHHIPRSITE